MAKSVDVKDGICYMCSSACPTRVHVQDGRAVKIDIANPQVARCPRWKAQLDFVYHPDRLRYPVKRSGERGNGSWQRIFDFGSDTTYYMFLTPRIGTDGVMRFAITTTSNSGEEIADAPETLPSGWHHVAVSIDTDNDNIKLYLDGLLVGQDTDANIAPSDLGEPRAFEVDVGQYLSVGGA